MTDIIEVARIEILCGHEDAFEAAVTEAVALFENAKGCLGMHLVRSVEQPQRYELIVRWRTIEDHVERFRSSPAFATWRALAQPHFASQPDVEHVHIVVPGFAR